MDTPYRVPWVVERDGTGLLSLVNVSSESLRGVTLTLTGAGMMKLKAPMNVVPGGRVQVRVHGRDLERSAILVVRWLRPNLEDYLWRISF